MSSSGMLCSSLEGAREYWGRRPMDRTEASEVSLSPPSSAPDQRDARHPADQTLPSSPIKTAWSHYS
ncbi:hypothetical protein E2C01_004921 [Portunus trituberculatus]|uniref:Uncharacterized protein n=1 Tax=Portunus trituberculatus TaxID=210409 RepID=A0A5B7CXR0_PORTR|nr:hypothetical protein [Portunus trituberculatus]